MPPRFVPMIVLAGAVACGSPSLPDPSPPARFAIAPQAPWAGSTVRITSSAFRGMTGGVELRLGAASFPLTRANDTTFTLRVPVTAGGVYAPVLVLGDSLVLLDQLTVSGYLDRWEYPQRFPHAIAQRAVGSHAGIMGGTTARAFVVIDLEEFEVTTTIGNALDFALQHGPGMTPDPDVVLLRPPGRNPESWRLSAVPTKLAEHPELGAARGVVARLNGESWLLSFPDRLEHWGRVATSDPFTVRATPGSGTTAFRLSPAGDLVAVVMDQVAVTEPGVPVYRAPSGDRAFNVPLRSVQGIDWSTDGRTMAVVGGPAFGAPMGTVILIETATGLVKRLTTTDRPVFGVALDPRRPVVYVGVAGLSGHPTIVVHDLATLAVLGEMMPVGSAPVCSSAGCRGAAVIVGTHRLFVVTASLNDPTRAYRFLLPGGS